MGGFYSVIEGLNMLYSLEFDYYYLFILFGGFNNVDGYNMCIVCLCNLDGLFEDIKGQDMIGVVGVWLVIEGYGNKIMGGYFYDVNLGEVGLDYGYMLFGYNLVYFDELIGQYFVIFYICFLGIGEIYNVCVYEMFVNEDGWMVVVFYCYVFVQEGDNIVDEIDLIGIFKVINYEIDIVCEVKIFSYMMLEDYNVISGDFSGKWYYEVDNIVCLYIDGLGIYKGVFFWQYNDNMGQFVLIFIVVGEDGFLLWGSKILIIDEGIVLINMLVVINFLEQIIFNFDLLVVGVNGVVIIWILSYFDYIEVKGMLEQFNVSYIGMVLCLNVGNDDVIVILIVSVILNGVMQI